MTVSAIDFNSLYHQSKHCKIYLGNALPTLRTFASESIHQCVTSPPYWGLRDYHTEPQIWNDDATASASDPNCEHHQFFERKYLMHNGRGDAQKSAKYSEQEHIPDQEVSDAICTKCGAWKGELGLEPTRELFIEHLMLIFDQVYRVLKPGGTCFVNIGDTYASRIKGSGGSGKMGDEVYARLKKRAGFEPRKFELGALKAKSLCMIPERFAIAMIDHGWILRNKIVWHKPNVMPSSVSDRFTVSYEPVYFFVKAPTNYHFQMQYEPYETSEKVKAYYMKHDYVGRSLKDYDSAVGVQVPRDVKQGVIVNMRHRFGGNKADGYGNATYSGKPWTPQELLGRNMRDVWSITTESYPGAHYAAYPEELCRRCIAAGCPEGGTVLDPFMGSGSTCAAAMQLARDIVGIELNKEYIDDALRLRLDKYINQERLGEE
jgi:DNA modification methylase